jgi:hypothetical protein
MLRGAHPEMALPSRGCLPANGIGHPDIRYEFFGLLEGQAGTVFHSREGLNLRTALKRTLAARVVDQYSLHHRDAHSDEMSAILPVSCLIAHQAQIRFVHKGCRLKGMTGPLVTELKSRETAELVDNQGNQLIGCLRIACPDLLQEYGDFANRCLMHGLPSS